MQSPFNQFYPFFAWNENVTYPDGSPINDKSIISFDIAAPLGIEPWDIWEVQIMLMSRRGNQVMLIYSPIGEYEEGPVFRQEKNTGDVFFGQLDPPGFLFKIGRQYNQGANVWNHIIRDLDRDVDLTDDGKRNYSDGYGPLPATGDVGQSMILMLKFQHSNLRVDNIMFHKSSVISKFENEPYLFKIGPRYAQLFEPYCYLFYADYRVYTDTPSVTDLLFMDANYRMPNNPLYAGARQEIFETDPNAIKHYWRDLGYNPNYGYCTDSNHRAYDETTAAHFGEPDPNISALLGRDFFVIESLPIFKDSNFNIHPVKGIQNPAYVAGYSGNRTFLWNATVGGFAAQGIEFEGVNPLPVDPTDGMPTYIPVYGQEKTMDAVKRYGEPFFGPQIVPYLEAALYNAGFLFWPGIARLNYTPMTFEDIILSIEVSNGRTSDYETFPIEVVNYPVENYPPHIEDVDDQLFPVQGPAAETTYALSVVDPDCMIFSLAHTVGQEAATTHAPLIPGFYDRIRMDMSTITWLITLDNLPAYQYGPWTNTVINPKTGVIHFTPQFEGAYNAVIVATDKYGASSIASFTIFCAQSGTWLNHPPIILMDWDHPQTVKAGDYLVLTSPEIQVVDPDGDKLYYACNIGSCGSGLNGELMWSFYTYFPGYYPVEIIVYDIRGGYAIVTIDLEVTPWWTF